jgi:hypothetical protein
MLVNEVQKNLITGKAIYAYFLLAIITLLFYFKCIYYDFSPLDEHWLILGDTDFLAEWVNVLFAFRDSVQEIYYRPLLMISFMLDYQAGKVDPRIYHFTNILLHTISVLLLYRFMLIMKVGNIRAFVVCLLFAVHPLLLHAVAWIPGRNDVMLCIFMFASLIHLQRFAAGGRLIHKYLHVFFFVCAILTKESAVILPLLFLVFYLPHKPGKKNIIALTLFWIATVVVWHFVRKAVLTKEAITFSANLKDISEFILAMISFAGKSIFATSLSVTPVPATFAVIPGVLALVLITFLYFRATENRSLALAGLMIFVLLLLLPVWFGALTPLGEQYEHRAYSSVAGLCIFLSQLKIKNARITTAVLAGMVVVYGFKSFVRMDVYKLRFTYLAEAIKHNPGNYFLHLRMGHLNVEVNDHRTAIYHFSNALALQPNKVQIYISRAECYEKLALHKEAEADYMKANELAAIRHSKEGPLKKQHAPSHDAQISLYSKMIETQPDNALFYVSRAQVYFHKKMKKEALADLETACRLEPGNKQYRQYYEDLKAAMKP